MTTVITEQTRNLVTVINESPQRLVVENSESVDNIVVRSEGVQGSNGVGVPVGGTAGQVLAKIDGTNYNTEWVDDSGGVTDHTLLTNIGTNTHAQIDSHIASTSNPHSVTKSQVGLGNADNTSDLAKPISTATQTALDLKVDENAAITGATKTKITYDAKGLVTAGADATTADIADSSNRRYVTDAQLTVIGNTSGTNSGNVTLGAIGSTPNANAATLSSQALNLEPASASFGGVVTTATQEFKGQKTVSSNLTTESPLILQAIAAQTGSLLRINNSSASEIASINPSGKFLAPIASASLPSFSFLADPDTGVYSTGTNSISIAANGSEAMRIGISNSPYTNIGGNFTSTTHGTCVTSIASNVVGFGIKAANGQSVNIFDYRSFAGTVLGGITNVGGMFIGDTAATANKSHIFKSISSSSSSFAIKAINSQTPNLLDLVNSAGTTIAGVTVAGQIYAMSGANSTPGFAFATAGSLDSNTGFYSPGADRIGFTNGAAQSAEISAAGRTHIGANFTADTHQALVTSSNVAIPTFGLRGKTSQTADFMQWLTADGTGIYGRIAINGCIRMPSGSVGAGTLSYSFESDTNTGIYQSAADAIDFATNGNRVFNMDSKGNLRAFDLHNNATANGDADNQDIRSGTRSTSVVGTENIESYSASDMQWLRVGNVVTVSGNFIDLSIHSSSTWTYLTIRVPVGTAATTVESISGTMSIVDGGNKLVFAGTVTNDGSGNATIGFFPATSGAMTPLTFHFTYEVQ